MESYWLIAVQSYWLWRILMGRQWLVVENFYQQHFLFHSQHLEVIPVEAEWEKGENERR